MINFKRVISACLATCMVVGMTACNNGKKSGSGEQAVTEPREDGSNPGAISSEVIQPTYFFNTGSYIFTGEEPVFETIKYYTNIDFEPQCVPLASYEEKVATVLAGGNLPDLLCLRSANMSKEYGLKGAFINLSPYIEEGKMPNFINMLREYPPAESVAKNSDGNIYGTPRIYDGMIMDESWIIRYDILEKHNIAIPTTFEEMYDVLVQLKELYPDSYPYTSRWGATHAIDAQGDFRNARTVMMIDLDTRKYSYGPAQPGYIDCLKFMRDCYANGLLHPEFATLSDEQFLEQFANNKAFMTYDYVTFADEIMQTNAASLDEGWDLRTFVQPTYNGKRYGTWTLNGYYGMTKVIAESSQYKEELVKYLDWTYSEEGIKALDYGIKGQMWNEDEEGNITFEEGYDPKKVDNVESLGLNKVEFQNVVDEEGYRVLGITPGSQAEKSYNTLKEADAFDPDPRTPASWYNEDDQKRYNDIMTPIDTYVEECSMKVITGEMALEDWNSVVLPQCEAMGYKEALEMINKALEQTIQA